MIVKIKFAPFVIFTLAFALLFKLGMWQIDRWKEKAELSLKYEINSKVTISDHELDSDIDLLNYKNIIMTGTWQPDDIFFLDMRKHNGVSGMQVVMPLLLNNGKKVLVNRGWIKHLPANKKDPVVISPKTIQTITGTIKQINKSYFMTNNDSSIRKMFIDIEKLTLANNKLFPAVVYQTDGEQDGLIRDWERPNFRPSMHLGYAIMWFSFALILVVMALYMSINRENN
jgi:surfeit locus 1 family protein